MEKKSWKLAQLTFAILMSILLLGYLIVIATYKDTTATGQSYFLPIQFWILRLVTSIMAICLGKLWKDKGFLILMVYLFLKVIRVVVDNPIFLFDESVSESILTGLWVFSACYGVAKIFDKPHLKQFLTINAVLWTFGVVVYSLLGIYAAWTGKYIFNIGRGSYWGIYDHRLMLVYYTTISAAVLSISALIVFICFIQSKNIISRILLLSSFVIMIIALSLTDTRTAQVTVSVGVAVLVGIEVFRRFFFCEKSREKRIFLAWAFAIVTTGIVFVAIVCVCSKTITAFNYVKKNGLVITSSFAEEIETTTISNRGFGGSDPFTSRRAIWHWTLYTLQTHPDLFLYGTSIHQPMTLVNQVLWYDAPHCHSMPLMILLENGVFGVCLVLLFLTIAMVRSFRIVLTFESTWERFLIPVCLSLAIGEFVECLLWLQSGEAPMLAFFFIAIGIVINTGQKSVVTT